MAKVAFLGLGVMGYPMAAHLKNRGGHVLHVVCDLTIAAENARFGQTGPKVGSFDGGKGTLRLNPTPEEVTRIRQTQERQLSLIHI